MEVITPISWPPFPGQRLTRFEINNAELDGIRVGGNPQSGITYSKSLSEVLVFMGEAGEDNGYGKWDFIDGTRVSYTGAGRIGNQDPNRFDNQYIISAPVSRTIRLFWRSHRSDPYEYVGEIKQALPWEMKRAPDRNGEDRDVVVFTFDIVGDFFGERHIPASRRAPIITNSDREWTPPSTTDVISSGSEGGVVKRKEHNLQRDFGEWLLRNGVDVRSQTIEGQVPDFVDATNRMVIEAKRSSERHAIRQAIGQVLDYADAARRTGLALKPAILVPVRPDDHRAQLVLNLGIILIYRDEKNGFTYEYPDVN